MKNEETNKDELPINVEGAHEVTGYKVSYIRLLASKGKIPVYRGNGGRLFFFKSELLAWVRGELKTEPQAAA